MENESPSDICTRQLISQLTTNQLVVEVSVSYVEYILQMLTFSNHVIHKERHLENILSGFIHKNKRVLIIQHGPFRTSQNRENCKIDETECHEPCAFNPAMGPNPQQ